MARLEETAQRRRGERRRPEKNQPHSARTVSSMWCRCVPPQKIRPHASH
jgi:hypothetical protein